MERSKTAVQAGWLGWAGLGAVKGVKKEEALKHVLVSATWETRDSSSILYGLHGVVGRARVKRNHFYLTTKIHLVETAFPVDIHDDPRASDANGFSTLCPLWELTAYVA